jgi:hypothetical protein
LQAEIYTKIGPDLWYQMQKSTLSKSELWFAIPAI